MRPEDCDCDPGTSETGWHEVRCDPCNTQEMQQWARALETFRTWTPGAVRS